MEKDRYFQYQDAIGNASTVLQCREIMVLLRSEPEDEERQSLIDSLGTKQRFIGSSGPQQS
jgi:hypothetical protein